MFLSPFISPIICLRLLKTYELHKTGDNRVLSEIHQTAVMKEEVLSDVQLTFLWTGYRMR